MFKKIIYSCMALSLTLLPASEVLADITTDTNITSGTTTVNSGNKWTGGKITNTGGTLEIVGDNVTITPNTSSSSVAPNYTQSAGNLTLNGGKLTLFGYTPNPSVPATISGGTVTLNSGSELTVYQGASIEKAASVVLNSGNTINLTGQISQTTPSLVLDNTDTWQGTIITSSDGILSLQGFENSSSDVNSAYQQTGGRLDIGLSDASATSQYAINNSKSYINAGTVNIYKDSSLSIYSSPTESAAYDSLLGTNVTLGEGARVNIKSEVLPDGTVESGTLNVLGTGSAVLNDVDYTDSATGKDTWNGDVILGSGTDNPTLTLRNVNKNFLAEEENATLAQWSGTLNIHANNNGGSNIIDSNGGYDEYDNIIYNYNGNINIKGSDANNKSSLTLYEAIDDVDVLRKSQMGVEQNIALQGYADLNLNTMTLTDSSGATYNTNIVSAKAPTGYGAGNTVTKSGNGAYYIGSFDPETGNISNINDDVNMGYNLNVENGEMHVLTTGKVKVGINDGSVPSYGDLTIGNGNGTTHFYTLSPDNTIVGNMALHDGWYHTMVPSLTTVGGNLYTGSGIDMMNGGLDKINVAGATTVDNLQLKIDVSPDLYEFGPLVQSNDQINSSAVIGNPGAVLNLVDYNLLSNNLRRNKYTFRVVNAAGENYNISPSAGKIVSGNATRILHTTVGDYTMVPSDVKGAFDLALFQFNPQALRGLVAPNIIYANQQVINNQLFDRMIYSNLPYFNGRCTNKTASADTLYSPYQYTTEDLGLWFKPYANFETIHMNYGLGKVRNNAYGAMIGADFGRKDFGNWSFIPSAFIGYNGGRTTFNGVGMWHNGGQGGLMGTLTNRDFITSLAVYAGGYHNAMDIMGKHDTNALWNAGVASKTAYNIHLPWDFILQPTLYMAYNYVGASSFTSKLDGFKYKIDPYNAYSIAPGVTLIWQKETFSIYALFQAMFNIGSTVSGRIAEIDLPHVGIKDPYFEYGLGASKFFLDRFSGYGQVVARSGSRKGVGFQLGLNVKM